MLLKRYGNIEYILELDVESALAQIMKAREKEHEQKHWEMYLSHYQHMNKETFIPFDLFYKHPQTQTKQPVVNNRKSKEEILADAENILAALRGSMKVG